MWITHIPTKDEGAYIETLDGKLKVWSMAQKDVVEWESKDTEMVVDKEDDFSLMLKVMVSKEGKDAFKPDHILVTCLNAIEWYLAHENLHIKTVDERLQTMQEVLYYAIGEDFELSGDRDKIIMFIHNTLPHLMMGSLIGFKLAKDFYINGEELYDPTDTPGHKEDEPKEVKLAPRRRRCWC
jgi:hypothetical protein